MSFWAFEFRTVLVQRVASPTVQHAYYTTIFDCMQQVLPLVQTLEQTPLHLFRPFNHLVLAVRDQIRAPLLPAPLAIMPLDFVAVIEVAWIGHVLVEGVRAEVHG